MHMLSPRKLDKFTIISSSLAIGLSALSIGLSANINTVNEALGNHTDGRLQYRECIRLNHEDPSDEALETCLEIDQHADEWMDYLVRLQPDLSFPFVLYIKDKVFDSYDRPID